MAEPQSNKEGIARTMSTAVIICAVCSVVVSMAAVALRPLQEANRRIDIQRNILSAANLLPTGRADAATIARYFDAVQLRLVDLRSGRFLSDSERDAALGGLAARDYDPLAALSDQALSTAVPAAKDIARIRRREHYVPVYWAATDNGPGTLVLPVRGYGLWSTLYGYLALKSDGNTIVGLSFYDHGETPGLGGEVDNPIWKDKWHGKKLYRRACLSAGERDCAVAMVVPKTVGSAGPHRVDGISGATLTSRGVENLLHYWLGAEGFAPFLANFRNGTAGG